MKKKKKQAWGQVHEEAKEIRRRRKAVQSYREEREERERKGEAKEEFCM